MKIDMSVLVIISVIFIGFIGTIIYAHSHVVRINKLQKNFMDYYRKVNQSLKAEGQVKDTTIELLYLTFIDILNHESKEDMVAYMSRIKHGIIDTSRVNNPEGTFKILCDSLVRVDHDNIIKRLTEIKRKESGRTDAQLNFDFALSEYQVNVDAYSNALEKETASYNNLMGAVDKSKTEVKILDADKLDDTVEPVTTYRKNSTEYDLIYKKRWDTGNIFVRFLLAGVDNNIYNDPYWSDYFLDVLQTYYAMSISLKYNSSDNNLSIYCDDGSIVTGQFNGKNFDAESEKFKDAYHKLWKAIGCAIANDFDGDCKCVLPSLGGDFDGVPNATIQEYTTHWTEQVNNAVQIIQGGAIDEESPEDQSTSGGINPSLHGSEGRQFKPNNPTAYKEHLQKRQVTVIDNRTI